MVNQGACKLYVILGLSPKQSGQLWNTEILIEEYVYRI